MLLCTKENQNLPDLMRNEFSHGVAKPALKVFAGFDLYFRYVRTLKVKEILVLFAKYQKNNFLLFTQILI